jgi:hypothetical protein
MTTFTTAVTKVQELVSTKEKLYDKAAGYISEFVIGRMKENKVSNELAVDIAKILNGFTPDEQVKILEKTIVYIVMNTKTNSSKSSSRDKRVYNDGFDDDEDDRSNRRRNSKKEPWSFFDLD